MRFYCNFRACLFLSESSKSKKTRSLYTTQFIRFINCQFNQHVKCVYLHVPTCPQKVFIHRQIALRDLNHLSDVIKISALVTILFFIVSQQPLRGLWTSHIHLSNAAVPNKPCETIFTICCIHKSCLVKMLTGYF